MSLWLFEEGRRRVVVGRRKKKEKEKKKAYLRIFSVEGTSQI